MRRITRNAAIVVAVAAVLLLALGAIDVAVRNGTAFLRADGSRYRIGVIQP